MSEESKEVHEQVRSTPDQDQEKLIEKLAGDYRMKGKSDDEADRLARADVLKNEQLAEEQWLAFVKKIRMDTVVDDLLRRSLVAYKESYKAKTGKDIDFKLEFKESRTHGKGTIWTVQLRLDIKREGEWRTYSKKELQFKHVKEVRDQAKWKFSMYESMFQGLMFNGITHMIMTDDARRNTELANGPAGEAGPEGITSNTEGQKV